MNSRQLLTIGQILAAVGGSIGILVVWMAFQFSCDSGLCNDSPLPWSAAVALVALLVGVRLVGVRTVKRPERFPLSAMALVAAVLHVQVLTNLVLT